MAKGKPVGIEESALLCGETRMGLFQALAKLDVLLETAMSAARTAASVSSTPDSLRGLFLREEDVVRLLRRAPGLPNLDFVRETSEGLPGLLDVFPRLGRLAQRFALDSLDASLLLLAAAPEFDLRYERIFAYLQDDVTRRRPSLDLALELYCSTAEEKCRARARLSSDAPLVRSGLLQLIPDPNQVQPPALAHYLKPDELVVSWLLGREALDPRLTSFCEILQAPKRSGVLQSSEMMSQLLALPERLSTSGRPLRLFLQAPDGSGKSELAGILARQKEGPLLVAEMRRAPTPVAEFEAAIRLLFLSAQLHNATIYAGAIHSLWGAGDNARLERFQDLLSKHPGWVILGDSKPCTSDLISQAGIISAQFPPPDFSTRRACWTDFLGRQNVSLAAKDIQFLAARFFLTPGEIAAAVETACTQALLNSPQERTPSAVPSLAELAAAARAQTSDQLKALARKVEPRYTWPDLILPADQQAQLREVCLQAQFRHVVYGDWGFGQKLSLGKGLNALFSGPPGTGKTMSAEVIACELGLDLFKIDLSQVVSKYIGETEKNLDRIFVAAENSNAILFFDEADALFGKRSEVKDAHDRYANVEIGYLLQKMEEYEGIAILATNLRQHMDDAFVRRMHAVVDFPFPDEDHRRRIWQVVFPARAPLADDVDLGLLAREVRLAGGNIRNIALAAAFCAASNGLRIRMAHLLHAARREYQKLGRTWNVPECAEMPPRVN